MILKYNLQFFAKDGPGGERTEPATAKKLRESRKKGQVAKSKEVANGTCLLALFLMELDLIERLCLLELSFGLSYWVDQLYSMYLL